LHTFACFQEVLHGGALLKDPLAAASLTDWAFVREFRSLGKWQVAAAAAGCIQVGFTIDVSVQSITLTQWFPADFAFGQLLLEAAVRAVDFAFCSQEFASYPLAASGTCRKCRAVAFLGAESFSSGGQVLALDSTSTDGALSCLRGDSCPHQDNDQ